MRYRYHLQTMSLRELSNPRKQEFVMHLEQFGLGFVEGPEQRAAIHDDPVSAAVRDPRRADLRNIDLPAGDGSGNDRCHYVPGRDITGAQSIYGHPQAARCRRVERRHLDDPHQRVSITANESSDSFGRRLIQPPWAARAAATAR